MPDLPRLADIGERAEKATKGEWFREYGDVVTAADDPRDVADGYEEPRSARVVRRAPHLDMRDSQAIADAEFIAHARTDAPAMHAALTAVLARCDQIESMPVPQDPGMSQTEITRRVVDTIVRSVRAAITEHIEIGGE